MPNSIVAEPTSIPAFIGYTEKHLEETTSLRYKPTLISSMVEYKEKFGLPASSSVTAELNDDNSIKEVKVSPPKFLLAYSLQLYFDNGGGPCYIVSAGTYMSAGKTKTTRLKQLQKALDVVALKDEPALLALPDASLLSGVSYYTLLKAALEQCAIKRDRFALLDVFHPIDSTADTLKNISDFRNGIGSDHLSFGAAYYPWLTTNLTPYINESDSQVLTVIGGNGIPSGLMLRNEGDVNTSLFHLNRPLYDNVMAAVSISTVILPPSTAAAATCVKTDQTRGVWASPVNMPLNNVIEPAIPINNNDTEQMNVDTIAGKSINPIRSFPGKGVVIWGARTLAGNDNEWRYVAVRRFFSMVEESFRKGTSFAVTEPNDPATWTKIKTLTHDFMFSLWQNGALQGAKVEEAFFVKIGLGETMTAQDLTEGRMVTEIGMATIRPAEFIILVITHQMITS